MQEERKEQPIETIRFKHKEISKDSPLIESSPIYLSLTSGVTEEESGLVEEKIREVLSLTKRRRKLVIFGSSSWGEKPLRSADEYQQITTFVPPREFGAGLQCDYDHFLFLLLTSIDPQKTRPYLDVMVIDRDLGSVDKNFVFGASAGSVYIQSVARFRLVTPKDLGLRLHARVATHEFGHLLGLPLRENGSVEEIAGFGRHCTNVCVMREGYSVLDWEAQMKEEDAEGTLFCKECLTELSTL